MKSSQASSKSVTSLLCLLIICIAFLGQGVRPVLAAPLGEPPGNGGDSYRVYLPSVQTSFSAADAPQTLQATEDSFAAQVVDGSSGVVRGVFVQDVLALQVEQQPTNNPGYVAPKSGWATQFRMASANGVIGLLAHNNLSGGLFFQLKPGDVVSIIYGDGNREHYQVSEVGQYQALQPDSLTSSFLDLQTGEDLDAGQLFSRVYSGGDQVTFQTCIAREGLASWGRLFVIAKPVQE